MLRRKRLYGLLGCAVVAFGTTTAAASASDLDEMEFDYHGLKMKVSTAANGGIEIAFASSGSQGASLLGRPLFKGRLVSGDSFDGKLEGLAFDTEAALNAAPGCEPRGFPAKGTIEFAANYLIKLRGRPPVRKGCRVTGYSSSRQFDIQTREPE